MGDQGDEAPAADATDAASAVSRGFDAELHAGDVSFGRDDAALLRAIDDTGSLNAAAHSLDRSYSRAHKRLGALESAFGPLVASRRGGADGGGTALTATGRRVLGEFERLRTAFAGLTGVAETVVDGRVVERTGELAVVETEAGRLRARTPPDATDVTVTVRSDTVTLHAAGAAPAPDDTSARNRFRGTVVGLDAGPAIVRVSLDVGFDRPLIALITAESRDHLELEPGTPVVASFKTTATRASPRE
jgi:molybdate transport system regulatory protein